MRHPLIATVIGASLAIAAFAAQTQTPPAQTTPAQTGAAQPAAQPARADPYANNAAPGTLTFPLAAPAGKDSNALRTAPPGAVNQGPFSLARTCP